MILTVEAVRIQEVQPLRQNSTTPSSSIQNSRCDGKNAAPTQNSKTQTNNQQGTGDSQ